MEHGQVPVDEVAQGTLHGDQGVVDQKAAEQEARLQDWLTGGGGAEEAQWLLSVRLP